MKKKVDERIKNIKIYVDSKSAEIQQKLFELGAEWSSRHRMVQFEYAKFLFVSNDGKITFGTEEETFVCYHGKEVKADEVLSWEPEKEEPTFEPFQKVLCRDAEFQRWENDFYCFHDNKLPSPHVCIGSVYAECIPYEGNEHLLGTTDEPGKEKPWYK